MLKALGRFVGLVEEKDDTELDDLDEDRATDSKQISTQEIRGVVSSLHSDYGIINSEIFFSFDVVQGAESRADGLPRVGEMVLVQAERTGNFGGWRATRVVCNAENWEDEESSVTEERNTVVGVVSDVDRHGSGVVNRAVNFDSNALDGFHPYVGDWVSVDCVTSNGVCRALSVRPLRTKDFTGEINAVRDWFGFVNGDIYFRANVCEGFNPSRGDRVEGTAIESSQKKCNWRVLSMRLAKTENKRPDQPAPSLQSAARTRDLEADKQGVTVSQAEFGNVDINHSLRLVLRVGNSSDSPRTLRECSLRAGANSQFCMDSCVVRSAEGQGMEVQTPVVLQPGAGMTVGITCRARNLGKERQLLLLDFGDFKIGRFVTVTVTEKAVRDLDPSQPYSRRRRERPLAERGGTDNYLPGQRPGGIKWSAPLPVKLGQYSVPEQLRVCVWDRRDPAPLVPVIKEELSMSNYASKFSALLYLEEIQQELDIREYDMERVCLRRFGEYLSLRVPGLAEGRPSVLVGDKIVLTVPGDEDGPQYEGYVHELMAEEVLLKFHESFHTDFTGEDFDVMFSFSRTPMRRCHQVVNFAERLGEKVLFPDKLEMQPALFTPKTTQPARPEPIPSPLPTQPQPSQKPPEHSQPTTPKLPLQRYALTPKVKKPPEDFNLKFSMKATLNPRAPSFSPNVKGFLTPVRSPGQRASWQSPRIEHEFFNSILNERQRSAVMRILAGRCRPSPYILFGPPGTGKTVTVVEAILQVGEHVNSSRILACAPSNSAADLLAERLVSSQKIVPGKLVRLNAFRRGEESIPEIIKPYCCDGEDLALAARHRVVIATCTTAASLFSLALPAGHFSHAFIDEAGQATEPECLCAVNMVVPDGLCVLAGDPMQLGPVLRSSLAKSHGLQLSYLERLMARRPYLRDADKFAGHGAYDPMLVTKLVKNYRSHPSLLSLPSQLFYHSELEVCADTKLRECLCGWEPLPEPNVPIIFHGIRGEDMREGDSPSWFNAAEAVQVMRYLQSLVNNQATKVGYDDIGIVTPYRKQVEKIRLLIDRLGMDKVKVGSVEEFQGQERLVIILSLVRSDSRMLSYDQKYNLGFLTNPKRFNVAITRPQALMIVVGNPHLLVQDFFWRKLLEYCVQVGAYTGCDLPDDIRSPSPESTESQNADSVESQNSDLMESQKTSEMKVTASSDFESQSSDSLSTVATVPDSGVHSDFNDNHDTYSVQNSDLPEVGYSSPKPNLPKTKLNPYSPEFRPTKDREDYNIDEKQLSQINSSINLNMNNMASPIDYGGARPKYSSSSSFLPPIVGELMRSESHESTRSAEEYPTAVPFENYTGGYADDFEKSEPNDSEKSRLKTGDSDRKKNEKLKKNDRIDVVKNNNEQLVRRHSAKSRQEMDREERSYSTNQSLKLTNRGQLPGSYPGRTTEESSSSNNSSANNRRENTEQSERNYQSHDRRRTRVPPDLPPRLRKKYETENLEKDTDSDDSRAVSGKEINKPSRDYGKTRTFTNSNYKHYDFDNQKRNSESREQSEQLTHKSNHETDDQNATSGAEVVHQRSRSEPQKPCDTKRRTPPPSRHTEAELSEAHQFLIRQRQAPRVNTLDLATKKRHSLDGPPRLFPSPVSSPRGADFPPKRASPSVENVVKERVSPCVSDPGTAVRMASPLSDPGRKSPFYPMTGLPGRPVMKAMIGRGRPAPLIGEYHNPGSPIKPGSESGRKSAEKDKPENPEEGEIGGQKSAENETSEKGEAPVLQGAPTLTAYVAKANASLQPNVRTNVYPSGMESRLNWRHHPRGEAPRRVQQTVTSSQLTGSESDHDSDIIIESSGEETS